MNLLKVLDKELKSPYRDFIYEVGKIYHCDKFDENPNRDCSDGFYATDIEGLPYAYCYGREIWHVEVGGKSVEYDQYKRRYETIKLIEKANLYDIKKQAFSMREKLGYKLDEAIFPIHPLRGKAKQVTDREIKLLNDWASVRDLVLGSIWALVGASFWDSVGASIWASIRDSVGAPFWDSIRDSVWSSIRDSVGAQVWASIRDSVKAPVMDSVEASIWSSIRDSVWDSARAYSSSIFFGVKKWKYIDHAPGINPYQSGIDLWHSGFVPSCDGKTWRLHSGKTAEIVYEQPRRKEVRI